MKALLCAFFSIWISTAALAEETAAGKPGIQGIYLHSYSCEVVIQYTVNNGDSSTQQNIRFVLAKKEDGTPLYALAGEMRSREPAVFLPVTSYKTEESEYTIYAMGENLDLPRVKGEKWNLWAAFLVRTNSTVGYLTARGAGNMGGRFNLSGLCNLENV
jgi:hypothetical protein